MMIASAPTAIAARETGPIRALLARTVRRIGHNRQMREFFRQGHSSEVERVAGCGFEGLDTALAKRDLIVSA